MKNEEAIIRDEAIEFHKNTLRNSANSQPIDDFHELSRRLRDFYTPENKAIFLDEIQDRITTELQAHRNKSHDGVAQATCTYEIQAEKLHFYIRQEIDSYPKIVRQKHESNSKQIRNGVFVSYSHADQEYLTDVKRHFKPFLSQIDFWDDTKIKPGQKWKQEIQKAMKKAKVAILLLSTDFLGSDFIATDELPPLLKAAEEDGAAILIVILKPCLFEEFPELNQYQAMNPPSRTILKMDYEEKEELYVNLVRQTKRILEE